MVGFDRWRAHHPDPACDEDCARGSFTRGNSPVAIYTCCSPVTIDPGPRPIEAGQPGLFVRIERPEHARPFH
jgi:hypothetical protein